MKEIAHFIAKAIASKTDGKLDRALYFYQQALNYLDVEQIEFRCFSLLESSKIHLLKGNYTQAIEILDHVIRDLRSLKGGSTSSSFQLLKEAFITQIQCYLAEDRINDLLQTYRLFLKIHEENSYFFGLADISREFCRLLVLKGKSPVALEILSLILELSIRFNNERLQAIILGTIADIETVKGRFEKALASYEESLRLYKKTHAREYFFRISANYVHSLFRIGEFNAANDVIHDLQNIIVNEYTTTEENLLFRLVQAECESVGSILGSLQSLRIIIDKSWEEKHVALFIESTMVLTEVYLNVISTDYDTLTSIVDSNIKMAQQYEQTKSSTVEMLNKLLQSLLICLNKQDFTQALKILREVISSDNKENLTELLLHAKSLELFLHNQQTNYKQNKALDEVKLLLSAQLHELLVFSKALLACCSK